MVVASVLGKVLIMAGGTGGHVYPGLAIARELMARGYQVEWLGTDRGLESRVVPAAGIHLNVIAVSGFRGKGVLTKLRAVFGLVLASCQSLAVLFRFKPGCVIGMGGYVAAPGGLAAWIMMRPLIIHEQNAVAGTSNRLLAKLAKRVMVAYPNAFPEHLDVSLVGNPVRDEIVAAANAQIMAAANTQISADSFGSDAQLKLLVLGGSLGAKALNDVMPSVVARIADLEVCIWHQTGAAHASQVEADYLQRGRENVRVSAFVENMEDAYSWADLVVCRAGALTVSELTVMSKPAILVPYPYAIDDHQTLNARWMSEQGAAVLIPQSELTPAKLEDLLRGFVSNSSSLLAMATNAGHIAMADATRLTVGICEEVYRD